MYSIIIIAFNFDATVDIVKANSYCILFSFPVWKVVNYFKGYKIGKMVLLLKEVCIYMYKILYNLIIYNNYTRSIIFAEAAQVMHEICVAVKHLHDMKVTHRDLKPENLLYSKPGKSYMYI